LIILTDPDPVQALRLVLKKAALLLLPLSVLFIKYYPALGRSYDVWTGIPFNQGVTIGKNTLGSICLVLGLFLFWDLLMEWKVSDRKVRRDQLMINAGFLITALWLLHLAHSATALACLIIGVTTIIVLGRRGVNPRYIGLTLIAVLLIAAIGEAFGLQDAVIRMLGRTPDLTDRKPLWAAVLAVPINPVFGVGFESFWSGERLALLSAKGFHFRQAHNGYIETYLNLGAIGLCILIVWIVVSFRKIRVDLIKNLDLGRFELAFLFAIVASNYTEASYMATASLWTMLFLVSIRCDTYRWRAVSKEESSTHAGPAVVRGERVGAMHAAERWGETTT
jgi:O-antigen ligase